MKILNLSFIGILLFFSLNAIAQKSQFKKRGGKYGYFVNGKKVINYVFDDVSKEVNNLYGVKLNNKWGVMDKLGETIIDCSYESLSLQNNGGILVSKEGLFGAINENEEVEIDIKYDRIVNYRKDSVAFVKFEGRWGVLRNDSIDYNSDNLIFRVADEMPLFDSCSELEKNADKYEIKMCAQKKMLSFIYRNVSYPKEASINKTEGTVVIRFVVTEDGTLTNSRIVRDIGDGCGEEALRMVNSMEHWIPGKMDGEPVKTFFNLPIKFRIE